MHGSIANDPDDIEAIDNYNPEGVYRETVTSLIARDGSLIPVSLLKTSIMDTTGNHAGTVFIASDISERRKTELELNMRDEEFRALVENAKDTIVRFDRDRRITYANRAFLTKFNLESRNILGKDCRGAPLPVYIVEAWENTLKKVIEYKVKPIIIYYAVFGCFWRSNRRWGLQI